MIFLPIIDVGKHAGKSDPERHGGDADGLEIVEGEAGSDVQQRQWQRNDAEDAMGDVPGVFIAYGPGQTQAGVALKGQTRRDEAKKDH